MPLVLDKLLTLLAMPVGSTMLCALAAAVALWGGWRRTARLLAVAAFAWLWFWATPLTAELVTTRLVEHYPVRSMDDLPRADAIVVLSRTVYAPTAKRQYPLMSTTADRIWHGKRLHEAGLAPVIIASGGVAWQLDGRGPSMASVMRDIFIALGVPGEAVLVEGRSQTTRENALYTAELAAEHGIERVLLVTEAGHMQRADACFRKVGLETVPVVPVGGSLVGGHWTSRWLPNVGQLRVSSFLIRERLGLLVYRLRGWV